VSSLKKIIDYLPVLDLVLIGLELSCSTAVTSLVYWQLYDQIEQSVVFWTPKFTTFKQMYKIFLSSGIWQGVST